MTGDLALHVDLKEWVNVEIRELQMRTTGIIATQSDLAGRDSPCDFVMAARRLECSVSPCVFASKAMLPMALAIHDHI